MFSIKYIKSSVVTVLMALSLIAIITGCTPSSTGGESALEGDGAQTGQSGITVLGVGEAFGQPDEAHVTVGVDTFAKLVNEATAQNEATIQAIVTALRDQGIANEDIQTSNYSLWAEQLYGDNGPEGIAGYRVSNQVNVTIRDIDKVGDVLTAATGAGANSIYGVSFSVADPVALEEEARVEAVANARERAESLAQLTGVTLGEVQAVSETFTQMPYPPMMGGMGGGGGFMVEQATGTSISPGQLSYQVQIQVTFGIK